MLEKLIQKFSKDIALDLGSSTIRILERDKGIVVDAPTVVSINNRTDQIIAVGQEAKEMLGKNPPYITTYKPLVRGVISDYEITEKMLRYFFGRIHEMSGALIPRPRVIVGVPMETTEVERKAVEDVILGSGAREVLMVEDIMAAAVGARLPVEEPVGSMIVDIGGGKAEMAVVSLSGIVHWKSVASAGDEMNRAIINYCKDVFSILLGEVQAEGVKLQLGSAVPLSTPLQTSVRGRDIISGLPKEFMMNDGHIREATERIIADIVRTIKETLESTPPELVADIHERGIIVCGGGASLRGIDTLITAETDIAVRIIDDPLSTVVRGLGSLFESPEPLKTIRIPSNR